MDTKLCRYCASEIAAQAIQCPVCKNYQSAWRNNLLFSAGIAGFVTLAASAIGFTLHQIAETSKQVLWREELNVLELETGPTPYLRTVLSNSGDGPVLATEIIVYWRDGSYRYPLDRIVAVNSIEIVNNISPTTPPMSNYDSYVGNDTGLPSPKTLEIADIAISGREPGCLLASMFDADNANLQRMKKFYESGKSKLLLGKAEAKLFFFSAHSGTRIQRNVPIVATFLTLGTPECRKLSFE
jgi:hypothetical protein